MIRQSRIDTYVMGLMLIPLSVTVFITVILFLLDQMLRLFDFVLVKSGPVELVWQMLSQLLPQYLSHGISLGLFIGIMLAFRKLSLNGELDALFSSGVSLRHLLRPAYGLAIFMMAANYTIIAYLQPVGLYRYQELRHEAANEAIKARIKVGQFMQLGNGAVLRAGGVEDNGNILTDIFIERCNSSAECVVATSQSGRLNFSTNQKSVRVDLSNGRILESGDGRSRAFEFEHYAFNVEIPELEKFRNRGFDQREATMSELVDALASNRFADSAARQKYLAHFHWRILHTLTFLAIPLVAVGFGITNARAPSYRLPVAGIASLVLYNEILEVGQRWVAADSVTPWLAMWPIFCLFAMLGVARFLLLSESPRIASSQNVASVLISILAQIAAGARRALSY